MTDYADATAAMDDANHSSEDEGIHEDRYGTAVAKIFESARVDNCEVDDSWRGKALLGDLAKATYKDSKWENAQAYLKAKNLNNPADAKAIIYEGLKSLGFWKVSDRCVSKLIPHIMGENAKGVSPAIDDWLRLQQECAQAFAVDDDADELEGGHPCLYQELGGMDPDIITADGRVQRGGKGGGKGKGKGTDTVAQRLEKAFDEGKLLDEVGEYVAFYKKGPVQTAKWGTAILIVAFSAAYARWVVYGKYASFNPDGSLASGLDRVLGFTVFFARAGGMAAAIVTAILYMTMVRGTLIKNAYNFVPQGGNIAALLDGHKDLHIFFGKFMLYVVICHLFGHFMATVGSVPKLSPAELNGLLGCANNYKNTLFPRNTFFSFLQWPDCPFDENPPKALGIFYQTSPGLSGTILTIIFFLMFYTAGKDQRRTYFERFWYMHNVGIFSWPFLLIWHGSNNWIGVGFPLVFVFGTLPILAYYWDRVLRLFRYYLFAGTAVRIKKAAILLGPGGTSKKGLVQIQISRPPCLWLYHPGMYAFICMPEYSYFQWHPFTIASGKTDKYVMFVIQGEGDWTQELINRCVAAKEDDVDLPKVAIDGPYPAPTQSALGREVLVAVGIGVGITPFFSLMSTIISIFEDPVKSAEAPLKEAHFFWTASKPEVFLFGQTLFSRVVNDENMRNRVFIHLHCTSRVDAKDPNPAAYMLLNAVKRQSIEDRKKVNEIRSSNRDWWAGPTLPWSWVTGDGSADVIWVSDLAKFIDSEEENESADESDASDVEVLQNGQPASGGVFTSRAAAADCLLPITLGRPNWMAEIGAIGKANNGRERNIHAYLCGPGKEDIAKACKAAEEKALQDLDEEDMKRCCGMKKTSTAQKFVFSYERFG